jgi:hypothetical protein
MSQVLDANKITIENTVGFVPCQRPTKKRFAVQIMNPNGFKVRNAAGIQQLGEPGDYLIIDSRGNREVCAQSEFVKEYVMTLDGNFELSDFESMVHSSPLPLIDKENGYKLHVNTIQDMIDGVPGRLFLRRIDDDGGEYEIEYAFEQVNTIAEPNADAVARNLSGSVNELIESGGFQTHDSED